MTDNSGTTFDYAQHPGCDRDVLNVSNNPDVKKAEKILALLSDEIEFIGCAGASFKTFPVKTEPSFKFRIFYRASNNLKSQEYLAPILHEIGHVYQLRQAGSIQSLLQSLDNSAERIELGADFLAGFAAHKLGINVALAQRSLFLVGSYRSDVRDSHGRPEDRTSAFRYGYFYEPEDSSLASQYADFQDNLFVQIKHSGGVP
jgi:hypothetical protein